MSVTLTYSGRLKSAGMIEPLLQELSALAEEHGWQYELTGPNEHAMLFGPVVVVRGIHLTLAPEAGLFARFTLKTGDASTLAESIGLTNFMFDQIGNFFDYVNNNPLPRNASSDDLLKDLSAFAAAAYKNAPYKPVEPSKLKNQKNSEKPEQEKK